MRDVMSSRDCQNEKNRGDCVSNVNEAIDFVRDKWSPAARNSGFKLGLRDWYDGAYDFYEREANCAVRREKKLYTERREYFEGLGELEKRKVVT
jgi:hypothetical protein